MSTTRAVRTGCLTASAGARWRTLSARRSPFHHRRARLPSPRRRGAAAVQGTRPSRRQGERPRPRAVAAHRHPARWRFPRARTRSRPGGRATCVPFPWRITRMFIMASARSARRKNGRRTPSSAAAERALGSFSPGRRCHLTRLRRDAGWDLRREVAWTNGQAACGAPGGGHWLAWQVVKRSHR